MMYLSLSWMEGTESSLRFKERRVLSVMIVLIVPCNAATALRRRSNMATSADFFAILVALMLISFDFTL